MIKHVKFEQKIANELCGPMTPPQAFLGDNERGRIGEHGNKLEARAEADGMKEENTRAGSGGGGDGKEK